MKRLVSFVIAGFLIAGCATTPPAQTNNTFNNMLEAAVSYYNKGLYENAKNVTNVALTKTTGVPKSQVGLAQLYRGRALYKLGKYQDGLQDFGAAIANGVDDAYPDLIQHYYLCPDEGQRNIVFAIGSARSWHGRAKSVASLDVLAKALEAGVYRTFSDKDFINTIRFCDEMLGLKDLTAKSYTIAYRYKGKAKDAQKSYKEALFSYQKALEISPLSADSNLDLAVFLAICEDVKLRDPGKAKTLIKVASSRKDAETREAYARIFGEERAGLARAGKLEEAEASATEAISSNMLDGRNLYYAFQNRAAFRMRLKKHAEALADLNSAFPLLEPMPDSEKGLFWGMMAEVQMSLGKGNEARNAFEASLRYAPGDKKTLNGYGILMLAADPNKSIELFSRSIGVGGDKPTFELLGRALVQAMWQEERRDNPEGVRLLAERAVSIGPNILRDDLAWTYRFMARAAKSRGEFARAAEFYESSLELNPDNIMTLHDTAWLYATCPDDSVRKGTRAVELINKANALAANNPPVLPQFAFLDTLAAAMAEVLDKGDSASNFSYADVITYQQQALQLAMTTPGIGFPRLKAFEDRLKAYQNKQAWREAWPGKPSQTVQKK